MKTSLYIIYRTNLYHNNDIIMVSHHGSSSSTSSLFLSQIEPKLALISVGKNNFFKHPHQATIDRLEAYGCNILRTDLQGSQTIYFNDKNGWLEK